MPALPLRAMVSSTLLLAALAASAPAHAADDVPTFADRADRDVEDNDRTLAVMLNPLAVAAGVYGGDVDFVLGKHFAASVEGNLYGFGSSASTAFGGGLLFYPAAALHGFYVEPRVAFARPLSEGLMHFDWSSDALGVGATAGYQWTWDYGFSLRLGGGAMYFLDGGSPSPGAGAVATLSGPQLVMDGSLGWAF